MRNRLLCIIFAIVVMPVVAVADSYNSLWKKAAKAGADDLPRTRIEVLDRIIAKATAERSYGHLLKAQTEKLEAWGSISPDSVAPAVARLETEAAKAAAIDDVLGAVYYASLGMAYDAQPSLADDAAARSKSYFDLALAHPDKLARAFASSYAPYVEDGVDSRIFGDDVLHIIGLAAERYTFLHDYYEKVGNREAACFCALRAIQQNRKGNTLRVQKSKYVQLLDSLINTYGDLTVAGELAIERYNFMEASEDATSEDKMNYIDYALVKWGAWPRMNVLRNARKRLTLPYFHVSLGDKLVLPGSKRTVAVASMCNISDLTMTLRRVNVSGDTELIPSNADDYAKLKKLVVAGEPYTQTRRYIGLPSYKIVNDTLTIDSLQAGVYLVEFSTSNVSVPTERVLLHVSNLSVMAQGLPDGSNRLIVVNATTGAPVPGANVRIKTQDPAKSDSNTTKTYTCDENGELKLVGLPQMLAYIYVSTADDTSFPESALYNWTSSYRENKRTDNYVKLFSDRRIYRPGQTVHVAAMAYSHNHETKKSAALASKAITLTLRDANYKEVAKQKVVTDAFGVASVDFVLPSTCLAGTFSVRCDYGSNGFVSFSVEEYKRPTFDIEFDKVTANYHSGDTVNVVGRAKTYAGVPVQGAQVVCKVTRRRSLLWRYDGGNDPTSVVLTDTIATGADGSFNVRVPVSLPETTDERPNRYYNFEVSVDVTDMAGESHKATTNIPLSDRPTSFACDMPEKTERDSLRTITFDYRNNAGEPIDGDVTYYIDDVKHTCKANVATAIDASSLSSAVHRLRAYCGNDTIDREFIVFTMNDKKAVTQTHDWFYTTAGTFPSDGSPVYIQLGSSDSELHVFCTMVSGNKVLESGKLTLHGELYTRQLTYKPEYGDGVCVSYAWVKDGKTYRHTQTIARPLPDKRLNVEWITFRDRLTPGQKEEWTLRVTKPDGTPAAAQLMATLYDKSLDQIRSHAWTFSLPLYVAVPFIRWNTRSDAGVSVYGEMPLKLFDERALDFSHFTMPLSFGASLVESYALAEDRSDIFVLRSKTNIQQPTAAATMSTKEESGAVDVSNVAGSGTPDDASQTTGQQAQVRENLNETAFFYPALVADANGNINMKFTLPESVTTWKFMGFAHDKEMNNGMLKGEAVAHKTVMVQPNVPRFVRAADKVSISARLFNTSDKNVDGTARLVLVDPETEKELYGKSIKYKVVKDSTAVVSFAFDMADIKSNGLLICRVTAAGRGYSDGEQHYMAVLPENEVVINTKAFTYDGAGKRTIDLTQMFAVDNKDNRLTVEYTENPAWLVIQALPTIANADANDAISLTSIYYAGQLGRNIINNMPELKRLIELWNKEDGGETTLMSNLQKNEELKSVVLSESPWVMDAEREADQKRLLASYFDESMLNYRVNNALTKLVQLQNSDGSFSWWPGMSGNVYMTAAVAEMLARLNVLVGKQKETKSLLDNAIDFMGKRMASEVEMLKKAERNNDKDVRPSDAAITYLYICALNGNKLEGARKAEHDYLVDLLSRQNSRLNIYGKAYTSIIMDANGKRENAATLLKSIKEYTVFDEEMGRYFDTPKAHYSWFDYRIPTQTAAIEALQRVAPDDVTTLREMQRWLLQSKRTQGWDTPVNSVDAIYAFMNGNSDNTFATTTGSTSMKLNGTTFELPKATAGVGYVKAANTGSGMRTLTIDKQTEGTSWGAVYAQFMQKTTDVEAASEGMIVRRELLKDGKPLADGALLNVGDRITVRITVTAERDYDFVQIVDKRAACMEPTSQISGYRGGMYCAQGDNRTSFYFDRMAKGKHVINAHYYVDRAGTYTTGTCTVQCAYSPEYSARATAATIRVADSEKQ